MITIRINYILDAGNDCEAAQSVAEEFGGGTRWYFDHPALAMPMLKALDRLAMERGEVMPRKVVIEVHSEWVPVVREACWEAGCGDWVVHRLRVAEEEVIWPEGVVGMHVDEDLNWGWR